MSQFTLALNTSTIRPASLMDKIRIAGETGYEAIELWNDDLTAYEEQNGSLADVKRALDDYGLPVTTVIALHGWLDTTGAEHQEALEEAKAAHGASRRRRINLQRRKSTAWSRRPAIGRAKLP